MKSIVKVFLLNLFLTTSLFAQDDEYGIASYYSDLFHGKPTASGELYDKGKMTAAHKTLPFGTIVKVTHLGNNKSVTLRVNDRGPFISGRVIELSRAAAQQLDLITDGSARVKVTVVKDAKAAAPAIATTAPAVEKPAVEAPPTTTTKAVPTPASVEDKAIVKNKIEPKINQKPAAKPAEKPTAPTRPAETSTSAGTSVLVRGAQEFKPYDLYEVQLKRPEKKGFGVQVAALASQEALFRKIAELQGEWFENILVSVEKDKDGVLYKIILGPHATEAEAQVYKSNLKKKKKIKGFVVDLSKLTAE